MTASGQRRSGSDEAQAGGISRRINDPEFQQELRTALQPVLADLQGQIERIVNEQQAAAQGVTDPAQSDTEGSGDIFQDLAGSLRETFVLLGRTLRALLETVRSLLRSVGLLLRAILIGPIRGFESLYQWIRDTIRERIVRAVAERVRQWVRAFFGWLLSWITRTEPSEAVAAH